MNRYQVFHIGIPKSGTTTVQRFLEQDERLFLTKSKYFTTADWWLKPYPQIPEDRIGMESNETIISGGFNKVKLIQTIERLYRTNHKAHIIVTIREQRSALISMFKYHIKYNYEGCSSLQNWMFHTNLGMDYLSLNYYDVMIKNILAYFPKEQIHVLHFEELKENPDSFYNKIYDILNIPVFENTKLSKSHNVMNFNEDELYTLSMWNKYSFSKMKVNRNPSSVFGKIRRLENKCKWKLVKKFKQSKNQDYFNLDQVDKIDRIYEEWSQSNHGLIDLGFTTRDELKKYGYLI